MSALLDSNDARAQPSDSARFPRESGVGAHRAGRVAAVAQLAQLARLARLAHSRLTAASAVAHFNAAIGPHHVACRAYVACLAY